MKLIDVSAKGMFVHARFSKINKLDWLCEYEAQLEKGNFEIERCKVNEIAVMTDEEYDEFAHSFLDDRDWLAGKGGSSTDAPDFPAGVPWHQLTEAQKELFRLTYYLETVAVKAPNRRILFIDPSGFQYARYVGMC